jgi:uncharacterized membrane protein
LRSHAKAALRTAPSVQVRALKSPAFEMARKARRQASCTTSSASMRLPVIQRASV